MGKIKRLLTDHKGFKITGTAMLKLWDGTIGEIWMDSFILTHDKLTHTNIKHGINDAKHGCQKILSATVHIYSMYGAGYIQYNRSISLNEAQCQEACVGIIN